VLPPGVPWGGYQRKGVTVGQSPGWLIESTMDRAYRDLAAHALFGISGFRLSTVSAGAYLTLTADNSDFNFDRLIVCAVNGPAAGAYDVTEGGQTTHVDLHADDQHVACQTFQSAEMQGAAQLSVTAGPVTITSWGAFRDDGGVTVSNLGVVGAQISQFGETDDAADQAEIDAYQPDLIVIAFGTNDGFVGRFEPQSYELTLRHEIRRVRRMAPGVPILLLGAPDAGASPTRTDVLNNAVTSDPRPPPGAWYPPPGLAAVRQIQRHVAAELGLAFWDWSMRMGGPYTADRWANADPPLMRKDRVHYTSAGGIRIAELLEADLDAARAAYILSDR
jgi:lysophospholipase L1-like esterase